MDHRAVSLALAASFTTALALMAVAITAAPAAAQGTTAPLVAREGWAVMPTPHSFPVLVGRLEEAVKANKMGLVTAASASDGAKAQGFTIPGNRVVGVFRNDFARRMLAASVPAGIEAPIRFYLTENADGTATLSYRKPSAVFGPYLEGAAPDLKAVATELDAIFDQIAKAAAQR
jgi:uncharacterized protein (DUF302 family)